MLSFHSLSRSLVTVVILGQVLWQVYSAEELRSRKEFLRLIKKGSPISLSVVMPDTV